MTVISLLIIILQFFLSYRKLSYGLACFLSVRVLVPEITRSPISSLSLNSFLILILLLITILKGNFQLNRIFNDRFGKFILIFIGLQILFLFFSDYLDLARQLSACIQFLFTDIMPAILAICIIKTEKDLDVLLRCIVYTMLISLVYGIYTFIINSNPWCDYVESYYPRYTVNGNIFESFDYLQRRSTKSTFVSHNCFGYYLTYMFAFLLMLRDKLSHKLFYFSLVLIVVNMLLSTKRSPIIVLMFIVSFLSWYKKKWILPMALFITVFFIVLFTVPALEYARNFFMTAIFFWDDNYATSLDVGGSNMELRIRQILYPFVEIKDNILLGHGFGWCSTYLGIHQDIHPILYGFETIFSTVICEGGLFGIVLYSLLFFNAYKYIRYYIIDRNINYPLLFVLSILLLYMATGIQYMYSFFVLLVILYKSTIIGISHKKI